MWHCGKGKTMEIVKRSVVSGGWGWEREKYIDKAKGIIRAVKLLYDTIAWANRFMWVFPIRCNGETLMKFLARQVYNGRHMSSSIFQNPYNMPHPMSEPEVNYGPWVMVTCQCRFTSCNRCIALVGGVHSEKDRIMWAGDIWECSVLSPQFCCKPKIELKTKPMF